jgi:hypothetical protein
MQDPTEKHISDVGIIINKKVHERALKRTPLELQKL